MYLLNRGAKSIGFRKKNKSYVIGFTNVIFARQIQYNLHPEPEFDLLELSKYKGTLFVPKHQGDPLHPMNDGGYHMSKIQRHEFYGLPNKGLGIIVPYEIVSEDDNEYVLRSHVFDPAFGPDYDL